MQKSKSAARFLVPYLTLLASILALATHATAKSAGDFDYYILTLSWSPSYCADDGKKGRDNLQCFSQRNYGFVVHGLWPQYEKGYPEYCNTSFRKPSSKLVDQMLKFSPSRGLIYHEWKKHGTCTGLNPLDYFRKAVKGFKAIKRPESLVGLPRPVLMTTKEIEQAFFKANPNLPRNSLFVTCKKQKLREVRICMDKNGKPRRCSASALNGSCRNRGKLRILSVR
ncbi:ribonuclease T2 family protein [Cohaesibacter celericrescens]|nr:ribonuclease T2 [Cohaesibacter celericrescens]